MRPGITYCFLLLSLALGVREGLAQAPSCSPNMLMTPNASSYVAIPNPKGITLPGAFTIEFWAQSSSFVPLSGLVEQVKNGSADPFSVRFTNGNSLTIDLSLNNGAFSLTTPTIQNIQNWQHYALTFTPNDSIRFFVNGLLVTAQKTTATNLISSTDSIFIAHSKSSGATFTGNIDELRFWNIAKTSPQIIASKNTALAGNETGLVGYYSFDDDPAATIIHDFTGRKSEGIFVSSAALSTSTSPVTGTTAGYMLGSKELSIVFPDLICGNQVDTIVHIYNRGHQTVVIDPATFQTGNIFSSTTTVFNVSGDSSSTVDVHIQANPVNPGLYTDILTVKSATICGGVLNIPVKLHFHKMAIAFGDSVFSLKFGSRDLLPCDLPDTGQTSLKNTGTDIVTITSLGFSAQTGITIASPKTPFTIDPGKTQSIKFAVLPGIPGPINTILTAQTAECSRTASIRFVGNRIVPNFTIPDHVTFADLHLPPPGFFIETTIFLKNTGTSILTAKPTLSLQGGSGFKLMTPPSGLAVILPDSTLAIKVRFTPSDCGLFQTALHFQDQDNCGIDTLIPISITVLGPDVSGASNTIDLGASCGAHDTTITLINKSGRDVILGKPGFSQDNVLSVVNTSLPKALSSGDSISIRFHFAPADPGTYSIDAQFPLSPVCGDAQIHFNGILGVGKISLSDSSIDFGNGCDLSPAIRKLTITNKCGRQITVTGATIKGSQNFSITNPTLPFTIANNGSKDITIQFALQQLPISAQAIIDLEDSGCFVTRFEVDGVREIPNPTLSPSIGSEFDTVCPGHRVVATVNLQNRGFGDDTLISYRIVRDSTVFQNLNMNVLVITHGSSKELEVAFTPKDTGNFWDYLDVIVSPCGQTTRIALHGFGGPAPQLFATDTILNFPIIRVGSIDSLCTILTNPSCVPLPISLDSIHAPNSRFTISNNSKLNLPDSISASDPLTLCFVFAPNDTGSFQTSDTIRIGNQKKVITLRGTAGISDVSFDPLTIDFGDVLKNSTSKLPLIIHNKGSFPASVITVKEPAPDFTHKFDNQNVGATSSDTIIFQPQQIGPQQSIIVYSWENHRDTIKLLGRGILPGLSFKSSLLDFSKVRVGHDSVISVSVTNTLSTQIQIDSISLGGKFTATSSGTNIIPAGRSQTYSITYSPNAEMPDSSTLFLYTKNADNGILPVRGEGVDAHISVDSISIDFGDVGLQKTRFHSLKVSDTGGYSLTITGINHKRSEFDTSTKGQFFIPPNSSANYFLSFTPQRAIRYFDTLRIDADAPEKNTVISLTGRGVFSPLGIPEVTYSIPDYQTKVGDIVDIPISIAGKDLSLFNIDSFHVDLTYDPTVIYFFDSIRTKGTLSEGFTMTPPEHLAHDSIIRISGKGNEIVATPGVFFILRAMALLGPHDSTSIVVQSSDPVNTGSLLSSSGSFVVTDCENYRGGILFKGNYSLSQINPNPVSSQAHIDYEIGLPARVHLDLYDALGRHIKTIVDDDQTVGKHSASFSADDIPSGEYIYVFRSLEYESRGSMIIAK